MISLLSVYVGARHASPGLPIGQQRARHASPLQQPSPDYPFDAAGIFCGEYTRKSVFGEHFRNVGSLPDADFQEQPAAGNQMIRRSRNDGSIEIETVDSAVKSRSRLVIANFRLEAIDIRSRDVGGIADHQIEALSLNRLKKRPEPEVNADGVQRRVPACQFKGLRRYID